MHAVLCCALGIVVPLVVTARQRHKPYCSDIEIDRNVKVLPSFAFEKNVEKFSTAKARARENLCNDLAHLMENIKQKPSSIVFCTHMADKKEHSDFREAWESYLGNIGISVRKDKNAAYKLHPTKGLFQLCTVDLVWAMRGVGFLPQKMKAKFPHVLIMENPWIWRTDPVMPGRKWVFVGWDYINGYALNGDYNPPDRWIKYFEKNIDLKPWKQPVKAGETASVLVLGQVPTDVTVLGATKRFKTLQNAYRHAVDSLLKVNSDLKVVFRPHPSADNWHIKCKLKTINGTVVETSHVNTLSQAIEQADLAITISSTSAIEAIFSGVPVIALDPMAPFWPVSCHNIADATDAIYGMGCRPSRQQWLYDLGYAMWSLEDIRNGEAFDYFFKGYTNSTIGCS